MPANIKSDKERERRVEIIGEYFLETGASTREIANYISSSPDYDFEISNKTVHDYIKRYIEMHPEKEDEIKDIINKNTEKSIEDPKVVERVLNVARLVLNGYTIEESAKILDITYKTAERDINPRLKQLGENAPDLKMYYDAVSNVLNKHQINALNENRNSHLKK